MRIHHIELQAFGSFPGTERIDFDALADSGLFLLSGPTGAGKTTILDAICFALYNEVPGARRGRTDELRCHHADDDTLTQVVLEATIAGRRLEITRIPAQLRRRRRQHPSATHDSSRSRSSQGRGASRSPRAP